MGTAESNLKKGNFIIVKQCFKANKNDCTVCHIDELSAERVVIIRMKKENLTFSKRLGFLITDEKETLGNVLYEILSRKHWAAPVGLLLAYLCLLLIVFNLFFTFG